MCQGLLYALCYHLDDLLHQQSEVNVESVQLQQIHLSNQTPTQAQAYHSGAAPPEGMSPALLKQQLADLLPRILRHRYNALL